MEPDPIIDEIRKIRDDYAKAFGYDVKEIVKALKQEESEGGRQVVSFPPRRPSKPDPIRKSG